MRRLLGLWSVLLLASAMWVVAPADAGPGPRAAASTANYSELRIGGRLVAYVGWSPSTNTFSVNDAYADGESAVVQYKLGIGDQVFTAWNSKGNGTSASHIAPAGRLAVHFRACRADREERNFRCARTWTTSASSCLKHPGTLARNAKGVCVGIRGQVLREGSPQNGWGYRLRGRIAAHSTNGQIGRIDVRTHKSGESWRTATILTRVGARRSKAFDMVVHRGGYAFWIQWRICAGSSCTAWAGDMAVGIASARVPVR